MYYVATQCRPVGRRAMNGINFIVVSQGKGGHLTAGGLKAHYRAVMLRLNGP